MPKLPCAADLENRSYSVGKSREKKKEKKEKPTKKTFHKSRTLPSLHLQLKTLRREEAQGLWELEGQVRSGFPHTLVKASAFVY